LIKDRVMIDLVEQALNSTDNMLDIWEPVSRHNLEIVMLHRLSRRVDSLEALLIALLLCVAIVTTSLGKMLYSS
jgi:hypothetical protein